MADGRRLGEEIARRGDLAATHELYAAGFTRADLTRSLRRRRIVRVRQGWYAEADRHPTLLRAARVGGRATCSTALALHGVWVVEDHRLHVAVDPRSCQHRQPSDARRRLEGDSTVRLHWRPIAEGRSRLVADPLESLRDLMSCAPAELVGAAADSLLHTQPARDGDIRRLIAQAPDRLRPVLALVDGSSESGIEFLFRWRMRSLPTMLRTQVVIAGVGRVDIVLGERLVVELDGRAYHSDPERFEGDRRRDAILGSLGYRVIRFSFDQVMNRWPEVERAVRAALARLDHL